MDRDDHAEVDTGDAKKPKRAPRKKAEAEEKQQQVREPEDAEMVPEPKTKAKAKARAAAKRGARSKAEKVEKEKPTAKAKAASKRKAKAKPVPKENNEPQKDDAEQESEDEVPVATPKKQLFQSSDDESSEESAHERFDKKTGKTKGLAEIFEDDKPSQWKRSKASVGDPAASSAADPAQPKRAAKKKKPQAALSPLAKKMAKKRRKAVEDTMREQLSEDKSLQAIFRQHLKAVSGKTFDGVKEYLLKQGPKDCGKFVLDPYWGRTACGVKAKELSNGSKKTMPLVAYFSSFGTAPDWNSNMSLVYLSAWLMATRLIIIKIYQDAHWDVKSITVSSQVHQLCKSHGTTFMQLQSLAVSCMWWLQKKYHPLMR